MASLVTAYGGQRITAAWLNQNCLASGWTLVTAFANGWANHAGGTSVLSVRFLNPVTVQLTGQLNPGTLTNMTTIATLPNSSWYPQTPQPVPIFYTAGTGASSVGFVLIQPTGAIQVSPGTGFTTGVTGMIINGVYELDN